MKHFIFHVFAFVVAVLLAVDCALSPQVVSRRDLFAGVDGELQAHNTITEQEYNALREFWKKLLPKLDGTTEAKGIDPNILNTLKSDEGGMTFGTAFWLYTRLEDPDFVLVRFLRAREWKVDDALNMLETCIQWRIDKNVDRIVFKGENGLCTAAQTLLKSGFMQIHGFDNTGGPVIYFMLGNYKDFSKKKIGTAEMEAARIYDMENMRLFIIHLQSRATIILDVEKLNWRSFLLAKDLADALARCTQDFYPGSLKALRVVNVPVFFDRVWSQLSNVLPTRIKGKTDLISNNNLQLLKLAVKEEDLLKRFGGRSQWEWNYEAPQLDKPDVVRETVNHNQEDSSLHGQWINSQITAQNNEIQAYISATREWVGNGDGMGTRHASLTNMKKNGLELDSHFRARTIYHRKGIINDEGGVKFLHENKEVGQVGGDQGKFEGVLIEAGGEKKPSIFGGLSRLWKLT